MKGRPLVLASLFLAGCSGGEDLFPLREGSEWSYSVRTGLAEYVEPVRVLGRVPAAGVTGYEIGGPLGRSRLGWKGGTLYASSLVNLSVAPPSPPIPLLVGDGRKAEVKWQGKLYVAGKPYDATAVLTQGPSKLTLPGKTYETTLAVLTIKVGGRSIEIQTWYAPRIGPVRQEQRTDGTWDVGLEYLGGP